MPTRLLPSPVRRPLRFVTAGDMLPILVDALKEQGADNGNTPGSTTCQHPCLPAVRAAAEAIRASSVTTATPTAQVVPPAPAGSAAAKAAAGSSSLGDDAHVAPRSIPTPMEATVGNNKLIADQRTNTIILLGGADAKAKVFEILDQLDVRTPQVIIRTVIGELAMDNDHELGFQYLLRSNRGSLVSQYQLRLCSARPLRPPAPPRTRPPASPPRPPARQRPPLPPPSTPSAPSPPACLPVSPASAASSPSASRSI